MKKILFTFSLLAFLSCSSDEPNNNEIDNADDDVTPSCTSVVEDYITVGSQIWAVNNLDVTTYCDGTEIPQVESDVNNYDAWTNLKTGAWTYAKNCNCGASYTYSESELHSFGKLYNWYAVAGIHDEDPNTPNKKLSPDGWLVPTSEDFNILFSNNSSPSLRTTGSTDDGSGLWIVRVQSGAELGTNTTGFSALPAGFKSRFGNANGNGGYGSAGYYQYFWTSDLIQNNKANNVVITTFPSPNDFETQENYLTTGLSVRLIKSQ
jgi:uncharacterized protein (TIGR02145 family)